MCVWIYFQRIKCWKDITVWYCEWCSSLNPPSVHPSCLPAWPGWAREWPTFAIMLLPTLYTDTASPSHHLINDANINTCVKNYVKNLFLCRHVVISASGLFFNELFFKMSSFAPSKCWPSFQFQLIYQRGHQLNWSKYRNGWKWTLFISCELTGLMTDFSAGLRRLYLGSPSPGTLQVS